MGHHNCLLIAGEKSGEEHALSFLSDLKRYCPDFHFWGVGGDELKREGVELLYHLNQFSSWGVSEVITKIPFYFKALKVIENECESRQTKIAILIDFQTFNLKLAKRLKKKNIQVLYYVAPQAWAWKAWRAKVLAQCVHTLFTILPFEKKWFMHRGVKNVVSVNHPLFRHYHNFLSLNYSKKSQILEKRNYNKMKEKLHLLFLPGSRNFEVNSLLPVFFEVLLKLKENYQVCSGIVQSPSVNVSLYESYKFDREFAHDKLQEALNWAHLALAASGTVTLTCALFSVPTLVSYKGSKLNNLIFKLFVNYDGCISLANIVHEKKLFPEFIQEKANQEDLYNELISFLGDKNKYESLVNELSMTSEKIQGEIQDVALYMSKIFLLNRNEYGDKAL